MQMYNDSEFADIKNKILKRTADSEGKVIHRSRKNIERKIKENAIKNKTGPTKYLGPSHISLL